MAMKNGRLVTIVIEGMDNSGKSTLGKRLSRYLGGTPVLHLTQPDEDLTMLVRRTNVMIDLTEFQPFTIYDRFPLISEEVYGPVLRGGSKYSDILHKHLWDKFIKIANPVVVYCRPSNEALFRNLHEREQMEGVVEKYEHLLLGYDRFFQSIREMLGSRFVHYDWETMGINECQEVMAAIKKNIPGG